MQKQKLLAMAILSFISASMATAATVTTDVMLTDNNAPLGQVVFEDTPFGLMITPQLVGLPMGIHGFHIHEKADCGDKGMGAGGHLDPEKTNSHQGPYGNGHLGDLPILVVDISGKASLPIVAPRLKTEDIKGHALMIHAGGDNYTDNPPLGGGGARLGCAVIPK